MARQKQVETENVIELEDASLEVSSVQEDDGVLTAQKMQEQKVTLEKEVADLDEKIIELQNAKNKRIQEIDYLIIAIERSNSKPYNAVMDFLASQSKRAGG